MNNLILLVLLFIVVAIVAFEIHRFITALMTVLRRSVEQISDANAQLLVLLAHRDVNVVAGRGVLEAAKKPGIIREPVPTPKDLKPQFTMTVGHNPLIPKE